MTDVALREFLEQKICALDKRVDDRFVALDKALALQAREYERRLEALNGEQARIAKSNAMNLPRETYASDQVAAEAGRKDKIAAWLSLLGIGLWGVTIVIMLFKSGPA